MRKYYYLTTFIIILIVTFIGVTYSYEYSDGDLVKFELVGPSTLYVDVFSEYEEYGVKVNSGNVNINRDVIIDSSQVNMNQLGKYQVKYLVNVNGIDEYIYRDVIVIDKSSPEIELIGGEEVYVLVNGNYNEYGYKVVDNYDKDLDDKVEVSGEVDVTKEGTYTLVYRVSDNSGNVTEVSRKIYVRKPEITLDSSSTGILVPTISNVTEYSNTIIKNSFNDSGVYFEGYVKENASLYKIRLKNRESSLEYLYNMTVNKDNYYSGNLDLTMVSNGVYDIYVIGNSEERLLNKLNVLLKLVRTKVGNKLVTFMYDNDLVSIRVEDFSYKYDVVIDPGHGGYDVGASNGLVYEKDLNLKISNYEKCRYESMGYRVYMIRYDDSYGEKLGSESLSNLNRRSLTIGYYGSVSKVVYSNHHNGSENTFDHGFEIIVSNYADEGDLVVEKNLYNKYRDFYGIKDQSIRLYSRDYDTMINYNKINGEVVDEIDYYSVIRIPNMLFNIKNVIYEPMYLSNSNDYNWYFIENNYIKISEMKIEEYVKYMGGVYKEDNSMCK